MRIFVYSFIAMLCGVVLSGCSYPRGSYVLQDTLHVTHKRAARERRDIRDFIRPEETEAFIASLQVTGKSAHEIVDVMYQTVCSLQDFGEHTDFWQYPGETIAKGGGDCEDKVFLLVSALRAAGIEEVYAVKGRYLGGGHFWVEYQDYILDPSRNRGKRISRNTSGGYIPFLRFNDQEIFAYNRI